MKRLFFTQRRFIKVGLIIFFNCALCIVNCTLGLAQNPLVKMWDYRFGGMADEGLMSIQQTTDGGFILGGLSGSPSGGDKTQSTKGGFDYWIVKTDSLGIQQWDKDFGGTNDDFLFSVQQTADAGFILGGRSASGISGDKTQPTWGSQDYWIIKTDSFGNMQWDRDFGGTGYDDLYCIQLTADGGYILAGYSASGISGDKTQPVWGSADYWIVKTDSLGNKLWDKDFGGTGDDYLYSIQKAADGGFIFGGWSVSGVSGDKTQQGWGSADYWIVKTDSLGNKQWDRDFGGADDDWLYSIQLTADGGFILGGWSASGISGNKTQPCRGSYDYWIVKIDSLGNKQWDRDFGGTDFEDEFGNVSQTADGGYLIAGTSYSAISGDKTENNLGQEQTWIIKTDSLGNKLWDKTVFTSGHDENGLAIQTTDECYVIANYTDGGVAGYKTQSCQGSWDYWIVKFCEVLQAGFTSPSFMCPGTCVDFTNLSFQATSYQWSFPGASPDTSSVANPQNICYPNPGSYDVRLIASNANGSDTLLLTNYITVYPSPPPQSITQSGDTLFAIAGASSYQWYFNGNIISGATNYFFPAQTSGDYNVVATDGNGCEVEAAVFNVTASLESTVHSPQLTVFPNPVKNEITIHNAQITSETAVEISIYNMVGEKVLTVYLPNQNSPLITEVDVQTLSKGMYWLEINSGEKIFRSKFVKQ